MSFRFLATALTLATFAITLGVSLWHRHSTGREKQVAVIAPTASRFELPPAPASGQSVTVGERKTAATGLSVPQTVAASSANEGLRPQSFSQVPVPVSVLLGPITDLPGRPATLKNASARTLDISITSSNPHTGHQASANLMLAPFQSMNLDEVGFVVERGDRLTLHSPPFGDREIETEAN